MAFCDFGILLSYANTSYIPVIRGGILMLKSHFAMIVTVVLALVMGILMGIAVILVDHLPFNLMNLYKIWAMTVLNVLVVSLFVPYKKWSAALTEKLGLRQDSIACVLVSGIIPSLIFNTVNTLLISGAFIFHSESIPAEAQTGIWLSGAVHDWPIMLVISFFAALIAEKCGVYAAERVLTK